MIRVSDLTVGYGENPVINRLSFSAGPQNSPLILAGRNGRGKSTLLKALIGTLSPQGGTMEIDVAGPLGWQAQQYPRIPDLRVVDFVSLGALTPEKWIRRLPANAVKRSLGVLEEMQLGHLAHRYTTQISGGEWQMVCLAQLRIQDSPVWLLDEPTSSLDLVFKNRVFSFLWEEARQGRTLLLATHDLPFLPESGGEFLFLGNQIRRLPNGPGAARTVMEWIQTEGAV